MRHMTCGMRHLETIWIGGGHGNFSKGHVCSGGLTQGLPSASLSGGSGGGFIILPIPTRATCTAILKGMEMDKNSTAQPLWNRITVVPIEKKA